MHFHDLKPGWLSPHLCSICYLSRSLHQVHVPSTAVWFSSCPIWHSVEWNRWSSTTATWPVPACRNCFLAEFQHQQFAEVHQQPPRFQPADHLVRREDVNCIDLGAGDGMLGVGGVGEVAYILTTSAAFNWLFLARRECF